MANDALTKIERQIEKQTEKTKQLKARKNAILAREKKKATEQQRKNDTRKKILLGSYLLKKMQANDESKRRVLAELNNYLTENRDRELFGLQVGEK